MTNTNRISLSALGTALLLGSVALASARCQATPAQVAKAEQDLCRARAAYKLVAEAAKGKLDAQPGTLRAELDRAEDEFCAQRATADADAGI